MMGPTHLATGIILSAALTTNPVGILVGAVASLLPDIDEPNSMIPRRIPILPYLFSIMGHRTITHSLIGVILFGIPVYLWLNSYLYIFLYAYLSHLILDTFTYMGVPWLWPFQSRNLSLSLGASGGIIEGLYMVGLFIVGGYFGRELLETHLHYVNAMLKGVIM